jgi:hypothetical protein
MVLTFNVKVGVSMMEVLIMFKVDLVLPKQAAGLDFDWRFLLLMGMTHVGFALYRNKGVFVTL